jgi:hypothetical protein
MPFRLLILRRLSTFSNQRSRYNNLYNIPGRYNSLVMITVTEIREAIRKLPAKDAWQLARELREHLDDLWDKQFEDDVNAGRLDNLIAQARREHTHDQI